jgi:glucokinase
VPSVLAVDIGGTKLAAGVVGREGVITRRVSAPTVRGVDGEALFDLLLDLIGRLDLDDDDEVVACGVGCGGPMSAGGRVVSPLNIPAWRDFPLASRLAAATGLPTSLDNDAKALALGEWWRGAAAGERDFVAMVVSTGVGGGIVLDGRLLDGADGNAGHVGHLVVEPDGAPCECGARGCLEAEASGTAIERSTGRPAELASADVVARTGRLVGRALGSVCNMLDLRLVVVAGSVALGFGAPFFTAAQAELDHVCRLGFSRGARIVPGGLGADGPLVGAAAVGWKRTGTDVWSTVS